MTKRSLDVALRVRADLADASEGIAKLRARLDSLGTSGHTATSGLKATAGAADKATASLKSEAAAVEAAARAHGRLTPAVTAGAGALRQGALSAKQYQQATRQLPMQITDIVTGLASGQSPFMVAIQQGGQLRDSFGGIGAAARALGGALNPTILAVTAGAAAFGLIGKALFDSYQELQGYERALINTGNVAGVTSGQVADMADRVGESTGRFGEAEAAALALAQSGKFTGETLELATQAAVNLALLTGTSAEDAADQIAKLATEPAKALLKLNEQYHFLSAAVYEQVRALEEQGRTQDAVKVATEEFGHVLDQRAQQAIDKMGTLERVTRSVVDTFHELWNEIKDSGRTDPEAVLRAAQQRLERLQSMRGSKVWSIDAERRAEAAVREAQARLGAAAADAQASAAEQRLQDTRLDAIQKRNKAREEWDRLTISNLDKQAKLEKEITDIRSTGLAAGRDQVEIEQQVAAARARYAESLAKKATGPKTDAERDQAAAAREIENLQRQVAMLGEVESGEKRVSEEKRVRYEIEQGAYRLASTATQQQLLDQARLLDAARAERAAAEEKKQQIEKTARAYESLEAALRTPVEVRVDTAIERITTLNEALKDGVINATQYQDQVGRALSASFTKPPSFEGLSPEFQVFGSEQDRLAEQRARLQEWHAEQIAQLERFRAQKEVTQAQANAQELQVEQQHRQALDGLNRAQTQLAVAETQSAFDSMAQIAKAFGGEQSRTYKVLFAVSKAFAVAQAAIALAQNVAEASKVGFPYNLPMIAGALAQGAQIASLLSAATYAQGGPITGPGTGTSDSVPIWASNGEFMVRERVTRQPGVLTFLEDLNLRGTAALQDWRGYAEGGLITAREPRLAEASPEAAPAGRLNSSLLVGLSDGLVLDHLDTPAGTELLVKHFKRNPAKFRGALGLT